MYSLALRTLMFNNNNNKGKTMKNLLMALLLTIGFQANAGLISLNVSSGNVAVGESISVDIIASGFTDSDTFNFDLNYDTSVFSFDSTSLLSDLSLSNPLAIFEVNEFTGYLAFSFLDFDSFSGDFTLASFTLNTLSEGNSQLVFDNVSFYQGGFSPITVDSSSSVSIQAQQATSVPEPAMLFMLPLAFVLMMRKKLKLS